MQRIEFSELTNRLRRNLMGAAFLIVVIASFDIRIGKASASGLELENLTTEVILVVLLAFLTYHVLTFSVHAFEEYRLWELKLADEDATFLGGGIGVLELADRMKDAGEALEKIISNTGAIRSGDQDILSESDARNLKNASNAAFKYAKRFQNFPKITRVRFWFFDVGIAYTTSLVATLLGASSLPAASICQMLS